MQVSKLSRAVAEALANGNENFAAELANRLILNLAKRSVPWERCSSTGNNTVARRTAPRSVSLCPIARRPCRLAGISSPREVTRQRFGCTGRAARVGRQGQPETCPCVGENRIVDCWQEAPTAGAGAKTPPTIDCRNDFALHRDFMKG